MNQATSRKILRIQSYNAEDTSTIILESRKQIQEIVVLANKYKFLAMDCEWVSQPNHKKIALIQLSFPNGKCFLLRAHKVDHEILELLQDTGKSLSEALLFRDAASFEKMGGHVVIWRA